MLRRLALRDFAIVEALEFEPGTGFSVLTGETGAGKSILVDALQLALGSRGDAVVVREGAARAEISAEFDSPPALAKWLDAAGFEPQETLLLRRVIDAQGKSRAWINGSAATIAQLRETAAQLVDIHGQHAWQGLARPAVVRDLLDTYAGADAAPVANAWSRWKAAAQALADARARQGELDRDRERLAWQLGEVERLAPGADEWEPLNAEHARLSHAQALIDAAQAARAMLSEADSSADALVGRAADALAAASEHDPQLGEIVDVLRSAQAQLQDAAHTLAGYLHRTEPDPQQLQRLDERLAAWISLARRHRRAPEELPALCAQWRAELTALDAAADLHALQRAQAEALAGYQREAKLLSRARKRAAPELGKAVTQTMQQLGMAGGRFEIGLIPGDAPQSWGDESAEFAVAGHAGSTPRPLAKVASGGELSRIALAIAATTSRHAAGDAAGTLIFDEIDAGIGGAVAESVGRLMRELGRRRQVLAVTHLAQVAACADEHHVVAKTMRGGAAISTLSAVAGEARVAEIARMLGGERLSGTSLAHAQEMLDGGATKPPPRGRLEKQ
ncbi:MAG TPA: DNA repair protein RecN [Burkholderiaceae bacterium]|mgnify:CR=1 FL=1|nr:DNA repair protein RecN [Burkholderiaceae bacterium]